jgi:Secretion system C-terminal sorting domain
MSYAPLNCRTQFTHGQKRRMKNALSILPHLAATKLTEYAYVRGPNIACINELSQFFVYSDDLNGLTIELSDNFESETITVLSDRIEIELLGEFNNVEGSPGWIIVKRSGSEIGRKDFWVGIPQKMLPNTVQGSINVDPSEVKNYYIPERLEGAITHQWHFDLFDLVEQQPFVPGLLEWQYDHKTKYHNILSTMTGKCDGELFVYGLNDCGENMDMTENEGLNINVSGGDPNCPIPSPVPIVYYPNPADDLLEIDLTMQPYAPFVIKIYDGAQNLVLQEDSENVVKTMTMSTLVNGTYYMHIFDSGNNQILSVILIINH